MDFEKLGAFYLGKLYDLEREELLDDLLMYDARDLTTHAVCVGMTGSGKTGLCIDLLEEAALDRVPALIIDPKGDITNLLLTFPDLNPDDFRPWVNTDDARRKGLSQDAFAAQQADLWRDGLAKWGQDGDRIRTLRETADFVIYTPGSDAGVPVSILQSFAAPALSWDTEAELLRERIQGTVTALLGLVGVDADPVRSREHILLSNLFEHFWRKGEDLDLPKLIIAIQNPPIRKLGVFDIDTFFPQQDRFDLAMGLNNIIAAPAFQSWLSGQPLDIAGFLNTPEGRPRHSIFYIAHLSEPERMFFVTMLLNQLITWMRSQPGTTSLRALLYIDETFGFFPPVANPPSKMPILTLMKQARAFGVGVVLTTQNPADLDYKGLTNAGTWFIGRLQTERDKDRLLEGLQSASALAPDAMDRGALDDVMSRLGKRVFLLHNVHERAPVTFNTRWAMSYLRGPLTRMQVRDLIGDAKPDRSIAPPKASTGLVSEQPAPLQASAAATSAMVAAPTPTAEPEPAPMPSAPPALPAQIQQVYLPLRITASTAEVELAERVRTRIDVESRQVLYIPAVLGVGRLHFVKQTKALSVDEQEDFALLAQPPRGVGALRWDRAQALDLTTRDLLDHGEPGAVFDEIPEGLNESKEFTALRKELEDHLYRSSSLTLLYSPAVELYSQPDEDPREFRMRLRQKARELRDKEVDELEDRYADKIDRLEDRLRRAKAALAKKEAEAAARKQEALVSVGESVLGVFMGRRATRAASTALRKRRASQSAKLDVEAAEEDIEALQEDIKGLETELKEEIAVITEQWEKSTADLEEVQIRPRRADVQVALCALAWTPHWQIRYRDRSDLVQTEIIPAYG
ncbi:MAG: helicase HerA domain-containing protein [Anaerolineae bacterium]